MKKSPSKKPVISVVMPVYNAANFLSHSIESILHQTYKNFEFIIIDDGSSDGSYKIARSYARRDKRIILKRNTIHLGVSETVKKAIALCRGDYIARMDADDIAYPKRLSKQRNFLQQRKKTVAVGGQCVVIDDKNRIIGEKTFPTKFEEIYKYIFTFIPLQQPTLMIARKRLPPDFVFYRDGMNTAEEVELLFKLFHYGAVENLKDTLLMYRIHPGNTSMFNIKKTFLLTLLSRIKAVVSYNYRPTPLGVVSTFVQTITVLLLPQSVTIKLYSKVRQLLAISRNFHHAKSGNLKFGYLGEA